MDIYLIHPVDCGGRLRMKVRGPGAENLLKLSVEGGMREQCCARRRCHRPINDRNGDQAKSGASHTSVKQL